jgi:hypothetical protein
MPVAMIIPAPSTPVSEPPIGSSAFWPDIDPVEIREAQRIDNTVTAPRLKTALVEAIATTNYALRQYRIAQQAIGIAALIAVEAEEIDGTSILVHRYQRAVGCLAKALILERYRDFDSTAKGDKRAEQLTDPIDDCRRDHLAALADITGRSRSTIELI